MTSTFQPRTWYPSATRGCRVQPTTPELLAMAEGRRADWRPADPSTRDLTAIERETPAPVLLAEYAALHHQQVISAEAELHETEIPERKEALRREIDSHWDAIGHLASGA